MLLTRKTKLLACASSFYSQLVQSTDKLLSKRYLISALWLACVLLSNNALAVIQISSEATIAYSAASVASNSFQYNPQTGQYENTSKPSYRIETSAKVTVTRLGSMGFYRYDAQALDSFIVHPGYLANQSSLSGVPVITGAQATPFNPDTGGPFSFDAQHQLTLPLTPAQQPYQFSALEPLFIVADSLYLKDVACATGVCRPFNTDANGFKFFALTIHSTDGSDYTVTLTQEAPNSTTYIGYIQANTGLNAVTLSPGSQLTIDYDEQLQVAQSGDYIDIHAALSQCNNEVSGGLSGSCNALQTAANGWVNFNNTSMNNQAAVLNQLFLSKQSRVSSASIGDFVPYDLSLANNASNLQQDTQIIDTLPQGFRYQKGSARLDGQAIEPVVDKTGSQLVFTIGDVTAGQKVALSYVVEVTAQSKQGEATNIAVAKGLTATSNQASAVVSVDQALYADKAFLLGRVMVGDCDAKEAEGLQNVRIYMEDGTSVMTDQHGRWHIEGVMPGTHVLQLDTATLSPRYKLRQCADNTRKAGSLISRFVNVQGGTLWRENWYLEKVPGIDANIQQQMTSKMLADGTVQVTLPIKLGEKRFKQVQSQIFIPQSLHYVQGSTELDGKPVADIQSIQNFHQFIYQPKDYFDHYTLSFRLAVDPTMQEDFVRTLMVKSIANDDDGQQYFVISANRIGIQQARTDNNTITLRPHFGALSATLSDQDIVAINQALVPLKNKKQLYLKVTGHSDNLKIRASTKHQYPDNYALSKARAQAVADYISQILRLDPSHIEVEGKGPDLPVASNKTAAGRAANRRVSVQFSYTERIGNASIDVVEGDSGVVDDLKADPAEKDDKPQQGFINLKDGGTLPQTVFSVIAQVKSGLNVKLTLDDKPISNDRLGMQMPDSKTGFTRYTWVGLEAEQQGLHSLSLEGVDGFGIVRFKQAIQLRRSSRIKTIRLQQVLKNTADGRTPIAIKLQILDEFNQPVESGVSLQITDGNLRPLNASQTNNALAGRVNTVHVNSDGIVRFEPVSTAGNYRITLAADEGTQQDMTIPVTPDLRDWILVGFAEGSVGYNTLRGHMQNLSGEDDHAYVKGDTALFARGRIQGKWLLTMAYDSRRRDGDNPLLQRIDPQQYYTLYGDDTLRSSDAPSSKQLYLRIEKSDFYAMFGDYDTGMNISELSSYQRSLTGVKSEYHGQHVSALGFAAQTEQGFFRDDIAADGTSGLYHLSHARIVPGSDKISIEVRDRFTNEVLSSKELSRYLDYSIDYLDGTVYFRSPVLVQDENFNPQRIVAKYEVDTGEQNIVAGGRVSVYDKDKKIEVGLNAVSDGTAGAHAKLGGVDVTWKPDQANELKAELAGTRQDSTINSDNSGAAWLVEHTYKSEKLDTRLRLEQTDGGFGLGQKASDDEDIRRALFSTRYRFNDAWSLNVDANHQKVLSTDNQRDVLESRVEFKRPSWQVYTGLRHAEDKLSNDTLSSDQIVAGVKKSFLDRRLTLSASGETGVNSDNTDYPSLLSLGADYRITNAISVFTNQDFSWGPDRRAQETRAGVRATPWQGGTISTDVSRVQDEFGPRLLAHAGVLQTVNINEHWSTDFGFDRSQTLSNKPNSSERFDDRRPTAFGSDNDDYTAAYIGGGYRDARWQWTNRLEFRHADTDDKWTFMSGFQQRLDDTDTLAGRILHFTQKMQTGDKSQSTELDISYAQRPLTETWFWLNRTSLVLDNLDDAIGTTKGRRITNNTHLNNVFYQRHQLSLQYGARYVLDTIDSERYTGYTDLIGLEYRYDITSHWDIGLRTSSLNSYNSHVRKSSLGLMVGYSPVKNVWISLGYNFKGFYDKDFDGAESRVQGVVLDFRIKFDQNSTKSLFEKP